MQDYPHPGRWRRRRVGLPLLLSSTIALLACGSSVPAAPEPEAEMAAESWCLDCAPARQLVDLPQLENLYLTEAGRLFVTGQSNLYEILRTDDAYAARALLEDGTGCSGLDEQRGGLYVLCADSAGSGDAAGLYWLDLADPAAAPRRVFTLSGMSLPNGLVAGPGEFLYVTDGPVAVEPKIVRLALDPQVPGQVLAQDTWLLTFPDYPNGLARRGDTLFTTLYNPATLAGQVAGIAIQADGTAAAPASLFVRGIMDDLNVVGDGLLVTDWQNGRLLHLAADGGLLAETGLLAYDQPSSVDLAGPPLFDRPTVLVTERYTGSGLWAVP